MSDLDVVVLGGGGHVGLPLSLALAATGLRVGIYDTNQATLKTMWRDRTGGEIRFRLRKWLPHYLRRYGLAFRGRLGRRPPTARSTWGLLITRDREAAQARRRVQLWPAAALMLAVIFDAWLLTIMGHWLPGTDLYAAWTVDLADPWSGAARSMVGAGIFRHSPVIAQLASLSSGLPWIAAQLGFLALQLVVIVLMAGRRWPYVVLLPPVFWNLYFGNLDLLMGAAIVAGFRYPGAWSFLFLTKITPGIGVLWFAFRREWRKLCIALGTTAVVVASSFVLAPDLWGKWVDAVLAMSALPQSVFYPPLAVRLPVAVLLIWYAAHGNRRWLLPVACLVAVPNPWFATWAILGASVVLADPQRADEDSCA